MGQLSNSPESNAAHIAQTLPLPGYAHLPGINERHREDFLDTLLTRTDMPITDLPVNDLPITDSPITDMPIPVTHQNWHSNLAWCYGVRLLEEGFYWEAHEALEPVWMKTSPNAREQYLTQGVIQLANCALKTAMEKPSAATRLATLASECFERAFTGKPEQALMGLDRQTLKVALDSALNADSPMNLTLDSTN